MNITIDFSKAWSEKEKNFFTQWIKNIELTIEHCMQVEEHVPTPSDFEMVDLSQDDIDALLKQL